VTLEERQREREVTAMAAAFLARGTPPDDVGQMVLAAVRANRLYIHTDRIMADAIRKRTEELLEAMPA
jgi:hypothetical protein